MSLEYLVPESKVVTQSVGGMPKGHKSQLEELQWPKPLCARKENSIGLFNRKYKINIHEYILT